MRRTVFIIVFVLIAWLSGCSQDSGTDVGKALSPEISGVSPSTVNPGSTGIEGRIVGKNFQGLMSVSLGDGVEVEQFQSLSNSEIYIFFTVYRDASPGPRNVIVATTSGAASASSLFSVGDNRLPEVRFSISPLTGIKDTPFRFDASKSNDDGSIVAYKWKFGDGKQDSGRVVSHRFSRGGNFEVILTVTDNENASVSSLKTLEVDASETPKARFTVSPSSGDVNTSFSFDASTSDDTDGKITSYFWDFRDGTSARGALVQHKFTREGTFGVVLTVTDNSGEAGTSSKAIGVGKDPGPGPGPGPGSACTTAANDRGLIYGTVVSVSGFNATVQFPSDTTCSNAFYKCGDMRKASPENFYGIVRQMTDLGNGKFSVYNDCPYRWPPTVGETVFLIYKTCSNNFCP